MGTLYIRTPEVGLVRWYDTVREAEWRTIEQIVRGVGGSKALKGERMRFAILASFDFRRSVVDAA
jgi:hypothetical protein